MNRFLVRVELHGHLADYNALHNDMAKLGFQRLIVGHDGGKFVLPTAEYVGFSGGSAAAVRDHILANIPNARSNPAPWVLVNALGEQWALSSRRAA